MANVYATKTGNWSDVTVWNTGALPTTADDVRPNGFTVTINQDITVATLRTDASSPAVAGGGFTVSGNGRIITANLQAGTTGVLLCNTNINWFLNGNIAASAFSNGYTIALTTAAGQNFTMVGNILSNTVTGNAAYGPIWQTASCTINITGNITAGPALLNHGVVLSGGGFLNITGNITGGSNASANAIYSNTGTIITLNGITTGGLLGAGINILSGTLQGNCISQGASTAGGSVGVLSATAATTTIAEAIYTDCAPTSGKVRFKNINPKVTVVKANGTTQQLVEAGASGDFPIAANVRSGVTYASSSLTGTLIVPSPSNVRKDVATDATVGTADLTASDFWNTLTSTLTTSGSIGERLKNASTVQTNGDQLAAYIV